MQENDSDDYSWCAFEAHQDESIIIQYIVLAAQLIIFFLMIYAYLRAKRQNQVRHLSAVYKLIVIWLICFFVKTLINVVAFFQYIIQSPSNTQDSTPNDSDSINFTGLKILSSIFILLDVVTTFFLQAVMIYIPYLWMKNALQLFTDQVFDVEERKSINRVSYFLNLIKIYLYFRNLYLIYFIAVAISLITSGGFQDYHKYISIASLIDSIAILVIYPLGFKIFSLIKQKLSFTKKQAKSILIEYVILLSCNAIRIVLNSVFYFSDLVHYTPDAYCFDNHSRQQTIINCLFLIFGLVLMHIIPGSIILYVYWPSDKDKTDLKTSLLISSNQTKLY